QSRSVSAYKKFETSSGIAQTGATTTVDLQGTNTSNVSLDQFQLIDPGNGSDPTFDSFDFVDFGKINAPSGTEWFVAVFDGANWERLPDPVPAGETPNIADLADMATPVAVADVQGVMYT